MRLPMPTIDFSHPFVQKRLDLIGEAPLSDGLQAELDRRNAAFPGSRSNAVPWAEVRAKLRPSRA